MMDRLIDSPIPVPWTIRMMVDWNGYRQQLLETIGKIARLTPETVKGYNTLSAAGTKTNHLDPKTRELIALAVAVTLRSDGCITVHTEAAIKHGASKEEIAEALGVAVSVNAGAALVYSARVMDAYEAQSGSSRGGNEVTDRSLTCASPKFCRVLKSTVCHPFVLRHLL